MFGNRRSSVLGGAGGGMLGDGSTNINVLGATAGSGSGAPTAFQAWEKSCEDTLALQGGLYQWALTQQNQRFEDRERLNSELFGGNIDNKVFESAITFWFKDVDFDGDKVWEYFHMNN